MHPEGEEVSQEFDLVMPFLLVESNGGPYDDAAFVSGYRMGLLDADLSSGITTPRVIDAQEFDQADLIAMRHGYTMASSDPLPEDPQSPWLWVEFAFEVEQA